MKSITFAVAALALVGFASDASAKKYRHYRVYDASSQCNISMPCEGVTMTPRARKFIGIPFGGPVQTYRTSSLSVRGGKPRAWCGWYMRQRRGISDPSYNLAANWSHYGHAVGPQPGAVVVWRHHVGELVSQVSGNVWLVHSGNDGNAIRTRARSISGAIAFRA